MWTFSLKNSKNSRKRTNNRLIVKIKNGLWEERNDSSAVVANSVANFTECLKLLLLLLRDVSHHSAWVTPGFPKDTLSGGGCGKSKGRALRHFIFRLISFLRASRRTNEIASPVRIFPSFSLVRERKTSNLSWSALVISSRS